MQNIQNKEFMFKQIFEREEMAQKKHFLHIILLITLISGAVYIIIRWFQGKNFDFLNFVLTMYVVFPLIMFKLIKKGYQLQVTYITIFILWITLALVAYCYSGIYDSAFIALALVVMIAAILLNQSAVIILSVLCATYFCVLFYMQYFGIKVFDELNIITVATDFSILFLVFIVLLFLYQKSIKDSLSHIAMLLHQKEIDSEKILFSEKSYREIFDSVDDAIFLHDAIDGKIIDSNQSASLIFGYKKATFLSLTIEQLSAVEEGYTQAKAILKIQKAISDGYIKYEWRSKKADGTIFWTEIQLKSSHISGQYRLLAVVRDITGRKKIEHDLIQARELAEHSDLLKTSFLQNMSHEIRTPLNAIIGFSSLLNDPDIGKEHVEKYFGVINTSGHQLLSIVEDILTVSRIETGQEKIIDRHINLHKLLDTIQNQYLLHANVKKILLQLHKGLPSEKCEIITDETKLNQIICNLLGNALKFTHKGSINWGYNVKNNFLEFFVIDTGIGIQNNALEKIFNRFVQADDSIHIEYGGNGLGLSISKAYVNLLGGQIWVQTQLDKGSEFYFTIPYNPTIESLNWANNKILFTNSANKTILIAEDEETNFLLLNAMLIGQNLKILHAHNGLEAIEFCNKHPEIELVLMDIRMPLLDGQKALTEIRKIRPNLPIIAQTAFALDHEKDEYIENGFNDFIPKPIIKDELFKKMSQFLNKE